MSGEDATLRVKVLAYRFNECFEDHGFSTG